MILVIIIFLVLAAGVVYFIMNLSSQNTTTTIIPITMRPRTTMMPTITNRTQQMMPTTIMPTITNRTQQMMTTTIMPTITNRTQQMMPTTIMPTTTMRPTTTLMSYMVTNIENNGGFTLNQNGRPDLFPIPKYITYVYFTTSNVGTPYAYKVYYAPTSNLNNKTVVGTYEANGQSPNISLFPLEPATDYKVSIVLINKLTNEELTNLQPVQSIIITTPSISITTTTMPPTTTTPSIPYINSSLLLTSNSGAQNINKMMTGRIYVIGASGTRSRDMGDIGAGYGGIVIIDVVNAYIGICIAGPSNAVRSDNRLSGGKHSSGPKVCNDLGGSASSVAWNDGTEFLIAGAGGSAGKGGYANDGGENVNYNGGQMGQQGVNGIGGGPNKGADYSMNVGGGNGGEGTCPDGGAGGGGYGGGGGSANGCCGAADTGGGGGGNRVLNYKNCITQIILNGTSRNNRSQIPTELQQGNYGVPPDNGGVILFVPRN